MKKRVFAVLLAVLLLVAFLPTTASAWGDPYSKVQITKSVGEVSFDGGRDLTVASFTVTGAGNIDFGAFCIDMLHNYSHSTSYVSASLDAYLGTPAERVRAIMLKSSGNGLSPSQIASALGLDSSIFDGIAQKDQEEASFAAAQAAIWHVIHGVNNPTFKFNGSKKNERAAAALAMYEKYILLSGVGPRSSTSAFSVTVEPDGYYGPAYPDTYLFDVTATGTYSSFEVNSSHGTVTPITDPDPTDDVFPYQLELASDPGENVTITASITGNSSEKDAIALEPVVGGSVQWLSVMGNATVTESDTSTLTASPTYSVSYDGNGEDAGSPMPTDSTGHYAGDMVAVGSEVPQKEGYTFAGWESAKVAGIYWGGNSFTMPSSNVTFVAKWTINQYRLIFNNGYGGEISNNMVDYGSTIDYPSSPTRTGYVFDSWDIHPTKMPAQDVTINATWTKDNYDVTYEEHGGSQVADQQNVPFDSLINNPGNSTWEGHTFEGWFTAETGGTEWDFVMDTMPAYDLTLHAHWSLNDYTVTFKDYDNTTIGTPETVLDGDSATAPSNPSRTGWKFDGWSSDGGTTLLSKATIDTTAVHADITYVAQYTQDEYTLTINYLNRANNAVVATQYSQTYNYGDPYSVTSPAVLGFDVPSIATVSGNMPAEDKTVTVYYDAHKFNLTYMQGSGDGPTDLREWRIYHKDSVSDNYPVKVGYEVVGTGTIVSLGDLGFVNSEANRWTDPFLFETNAIGVDSSETVKIYWYDDDNSQWVYAGVKASSALYEVTYDANGGTLDDTGLATQYAYVGGSVTEPGATRTGYTFVQWNYTPSINPANVQKSSAAVAQWEAIDYTLTINYLNRANNAVVATQYSQTYNYGDPYSVASPAVLGFDVPSIATVSGNMPAEDKTVTVYYDAHKFNLTYMQGSGDGPTDLREWRIYHKDSVSDNYPVEVGYEVVGTGTIVLLGDLGFVNSEANRWINPFLFETNPIGVESSETVKIYWYDDDNSQWVYAGVKASSALYEVTYDANGGTLDDTGLATQYAYVGGSVTEPGATRTGYTFVQWNYTPSINPANVQKSSAAVAQWSDPIEYTITYDLDGGSVAGTNPVTYTVESADITLINPTKAGYNFEGWTGTDLGSATMSVTIPTGSTGNRSYTATWSDPIEYDITYVMNGGTNDPSNPATYTVESPLITLADPTRAGYNFTGWTLTDNIPAGSTGNRTFTATWSDPIEYTITYVMNDGTNDPANPATYTVESPLITLADPTRAGYNFTGWTPEDNIPAGSTGNRTFTATWSDPIEYTITYVMDGGTNDPANPDTYTIESPLITLADPARANFGFTGWTPTDNIPAGSTGDRTFTAGWAIDTFTVTFIDFDGTVLGTDVVGFGGDAVPPADPEREGYEFTGWDADYTNVTADLTVQAEYDPLLFTVTWENFDGTQLEVDSDVPYGSTPSYDGDEPTRESSVESDFTFDGWTPAINPVTGDVTYTAQYTEGGRAYVVRWENWDGTLLEEDSVVYGAMPTYDGETPGRADEDGTTFTFLEWSPVVEPITGDITYTAQFTETLPEEATPEAGPSWLWWLLLIPGIGLIILLLAFWLKVVPIVEKVTQNPDGTISIQWGYENRKGRKVEFEEDDSVLSAQAGSIISNTLTNPEDGDTTVPPVKFEKGRVENVFVTVASADAKVEWKIRNRKAKAELKKDEK